ncbi:MAG: hypothetical protein Q8P12_05165, partial [bacterium]|nr:hypothetical protein [bacterium]
VLGNPFAQTPLSTTLKAEAISFALPRTVIGSVQQNGNQIVMMPMLIDLNADGLDDLAYSMPSGGGGWQQFVALASGENTFQVVYSCTLAQSAPPSYRGHCAG